MVRSSEHQLLEENVQLKDRIVELEREVRQTQVELAELDQLYHTAPFGLCLMDNDLRFVRINDRLATINGRAVEDHIGAHLRDVVPEFAKEVEPIYRRVIERGVPELNFEVEGTTSASPKARPCLASCYPVKDDHENVVGVSTVVQDMTERKESEATVQQKSELLRQIISYVPHSIFWKDRDSVYLGCNGRTAQDLALSKPEDVIGKTDLDTCVTREQAEYFVSCDRNVMESGKGMLNIEERQQRPDGTEAVLLTSKVPLRSSTGDIIGVLGIYTDITERKRVEQELLESESRLRTVVDHAPEAIVVLDADTGTFVDGNENAERLYGLDRDALLQVSPVQMSPPTQPDGCPSKEVAHAKITEALAGHVPVFEWLHRNAGGEEIQCEVRLVKLPMSGRNLVRGSITDIRERKQTQAALQQAHDELEERVQQRTAELARSEERFDLAVKGTSEGIWDWDLQTDKEWWSNQFYSLLGYKEGEIEAIYQAFQQLLHPEDNASTLDAVQAHLDQRAPYDVEFRLRMKSNDYRWFRSRGQAVWDEMGKPLRMAGSIQDITDRKQAEEALRDERLLLRRLLDIQEKERRMVAYDIHDGFSQEVVAAQMYVQSILGQTQPAAHDTKLQLVESLLDKAVKECRRMICDLRPMILDEAGVIDAITHLVAEENKNASLAVALRHDVGFDRLDPKLEGAIFRIVQESLNNVKRHGQTEHAAVELTQRDGTLEIVVRDCGVGFNPEQVSTECFGLRGIYERARLYGGDARIDSCPGNGTTVRIRLPLPAALSRSDS